MYIWLNTILQGGGVLTPETPPLRTPMLLSDKMPSCLFKKRPALNKPLLVKNNWQRLLWFLPMACGQGMQIMRCTTKFLGIA